MDELAYLAGAIDCDGSISISVSKARYKKVDGSEGEIQFLFTVNLRQDLRGLEIIQLAQKVFGVGSVHGPSKTGMYTWQPTNYKDVTHVLNTVLPYLKIKKPEALYMLEALDLWLNTPREARRGRPKVSRWVKDRILYLSSQMNLSQQKETSRRNKELRSLLLNE
jgi:hypothetical protein